MFITKSNAFVILFKDKYKTRHRLISFTHYTGLISIKLEKILYTPYEYYFEDEEMEKQRLQTLEKFDELILHSIRLAELLFENHHLTALHSEIKRKNKKYDEKYKLRF